MPIYEYDCNGCGNRFEFFLPKADSAVQCSTCGGADLRKRMSHSSVSTAHSQTRAVEGAKARTERLRFDRAYEDHKIAHKHHD